MPENGRLMMRFHHSPQMNSWSCSATELVCRRELYTVMRPSIILVAFLGVLCRMQWAIVKQVVKMDDLQKIHHKENAYIRQKLKWKDAKIDWGDDYYMTINTDLLDFSISLRLQLNLTDCYIAYFGGKWGALPRHIHEYLKWYWVYSLG